MNTLIRHRAVLIVLIVVAALVSVPFAPPARAAVPSPAASLNAPASVLIGGSFSLGVTFDNTANEAAGFGPYLDVFLPVQGADGDPSLGSPDGDPDGISYVGPATYLGATVEVIELELACDGSDVHPFTGLAVSCLPGFGPGDVLLVIELPFGSFTPSQPPATVQLGLQTSNLADADAPLSIAAAAGFRYGADPLDNPGIDPPIAQAVPVVAEVVPTLATLSKTYLGPEDETATGPNFPRTWSIELTVADGQELTDVVLTDLLPDNVAFLDATVTVGTGSITAEPADDTPQTDGVVEATFARVTGNGGVSAAVDIRFYVPESDAQGQQVLDPVTGAPTTARNDVTAAGDWTPLDPRDDEVRITIDEPGPEHVLTNRALAIQKSVRVVDGGPGTRPGATLEWTLEFQVSDFLTFDRLLIEDVLSDGQSIAAGSVPRLTFTDATGSATGFDVGPYLTTVVDEAPTCAADGSIRYDVDLSAAVAAAVPESGGRLTGGLVDGPNSGSTQGTITFQTVVDDSFRCLDGGAAVDSLDPIGNDATISGAVVRDGEVTDERVSDDSAAGVTIDTPTLSKSLYARNGDTGDLGPRFAAGDTITYRLRVTLPVSNFTGITLTDFLPLPVLRATEFADAPTISGTPTSVPPPAGTIAFGPDHTDELLAPPTVTVDATANSLAFAFPDEQGRPAPETAVIDLLFTLTLTDQPFADGLFLTNVASLQFANSFGTVESVDAIVQFELTNPQPAIHKGVVATDGPGALTPEPAGPAGPWSLDPEPGSPRFDGMLTSAGLVATPLGSDLGGAWAGDLIAFAVVVENLGSGLNGAFDVTVTDTIPDGMAIPDGGVQLQVTDGTGAALGFTQRDGGLFGDGIVLDNLDESTGSLAPFDEDSGRNLAVITYVLQVADDAAMGQTATNIATVANVSSAVGGASYPPVSADATVTVALPALAKRLTGTGQPHTASPDATIGETAIYEVVVAIPPSRTEDVVLRDRLASGLAFVSFDRLTAEPGLTSSAGDFAAIVAALGADDVTDSGRQVDIALGALTNATNEVRTLTLTTTVVVLNVNGNSDATGVNARRNLVRLFSDGTQLGNDARAQSLRLVEPSLTVDKTVAPPVADAGDTVTFTITVEHPAGTRRSDAFDVVLTDVVPDGLTYVAGTFAFDGVAGDPAGTLDVAAEPTLTVTWERFPVGQTVTLTFDATVDVDAVVAVGPTLTNTAELAWTSLPGATPTSVSPYNPNGVERTGDEDDPGQRNDYRTQDTAVLDIVPTTVEKFLAGSSAAHTDDPELTIGEVATFRVAVALPEGELGPVDIVDDIPEGLAFLGGTLTVDDTGFTGTLGDVTVDPGPDGGASGENLTVTFADVRVPVGAGPAGQTVVLTYDVVVLDVAGNGGGQERTNAATVTVAGAHSDPATATIELVEPVVTIDKAFDPTQAAANDPVTITLTVRNDGTSDAFDLAVTDLLDPTVFTDVTIVDVPVGWDGRVVSEFSDPPTCVDLNTADLATLQLIESINPGRARAIVDRRPWDSVDDLILIPGIGSDDLARIKAQGLASVDCPDGTLVTFTSVGPLAVGAEVTFTITATLVDDLHVANDVPGTHSNTAEVTWYSLAADDDDEGERRPGSAEDSSDLGLVVPDLVTTKTGPDEIEPGGTYTYTITVENVGDRDASGVQIVDTVPAGDLLVSPVASPGGVVDEDAGTVTWDIGDLAAGASVEVTVSFTVTDPVPAGSDGTLLTNTAVSANDGSSGPDPTPENNTDDHTTTLRTTIDVAVVKVADPSPAGTGDTVVYTLTVSNVGNEDAVEIVLTDLLPDLVTFVSASGDGVEEEGVVTWPAFDLPAGPGDESPSTIFTVTVQLDETVPAGVDVLTNTATVTTPGDTNPDNDTATVGTPLDAEPVLEVTKVDDSDGGLVAPGDTIVYTIEVRNVGDQGATGVQIIDALPAEVAFVAASAPGAFDADTGTLTWVLPDELLAGDSIEVTLEVRVLDPVPGGVREVLNTVFVTDDGTNSERPTTDRDDETTRLNVTELSKALLATSADHTDGPALAIGEVATYQLRVSLPEGEVGVVRIIDQLPAGMAYVGDSVEVDTDGFAGTLGTPFVALDPDGGTSGQPLTIVFDGAIGDGTGPGVTVDQDDDPDTTVFRIIYEAIVLDVPGNTAGSELTNTATVTVAGADIVSNDVTATVVEPVVAITKTFGFPDAVDGDTPGTAAANDTVSVTLRVTNTSGVDAFDLVVSDPIDRDVFASVVVATPPDGWTGGAEVVGDGMSVTFGGSLLEAGSSVELTFTAVLTGDVPVPGSHTNTASVTWQSLPGDQDQQRDYGPVTGDDTLGFSVPDLRVRKEVDGSIEVEPGGEVDYTITVFNDGERQAVGVVLTDTLPDETAFVSASDGGTEDNGVVTWPAFDLAAGDSRTVTLTVVVDDPVSAGANVLTNTASAVDDGTRGDDPTPDNNTDIATVALEAFVDLAVTKSADVDTVGTGGTIVYTLTVTSLGNEGADGITLTDLLPEQVRFVSASGGGTAADGVVTWPVFDLDGADGEVTTATFTVTVQVDDTVPAGSNAVANTATVSHPDDVDGTNDTDGVVVALVAAPDLSVTKTSGQDTATVNSTLTYTIEVRNVGDQGATGVTVVDTLPDGLTFVDASDDGTHEDRVVSWRLPDELPAGGTVALTLTVTVDDPLPPGTTSLTNLVVVSDDGANGPDPTPENNRDQDTVTTGADLAVTKTTIEAPVPGATVTYRIVVTNAGPETVRSLSLVDTLPPGLTGPAFEPEVGTYDPTTAVWDGVVLAPGARITLTVTAQVSLTASGELTNQVTVMPLDHADPDVSNNTDDTTDPVTPQVDLVLDKRLVEQDGAGGTAVYELTVTNDGPSNATGVRLTDELPPGLTVVSAEGDRWSCVTEGRAVRCDLEGVLAPGELASVRLVTSISQGLSGVVENRATVVANEAELDDSNNVAGVAFELPPPPPPSDPDPAAPETPNGTAPPSGRLPRTGVDAVALALLGIGSMTVGMAMLRSRRGRPRTTAQ